MLSKFKIILMFSFITCSLCLSAIGHTEDVIDFSRLDTMFEKDSFEARLMIRVQDIIDHRETIPYELPKALAALESVLLIIGETKTSDECQNEMSKNLNYPKDGICNKLSYLNAKMSEIYFYLGNLTAFNPTEKEKYYWKGKQSAGNGLNYVALSRYFEEIIEGEALYNLLCTKEFFEDLSRQNAVPSHFFYAANSLAWLDVSLKEIWLSQNDRRKNRKLLESTLRRIETSLLAIESLNPNFNDGYVQIMFGRIYDDPFLPYTSRYREDKNTLAENYFTEAVKRNPYNHLAHYYLFKYYITKREDEDIKKATDEACWLVRNYLDPDFRKVFPITARKEYLEAYVTSEFLCK